MQVLRSLVSEQERRAIRGKLRQVGQSGEVASVVVVYPRQVAGLAHRQRAKVLRPPKCLRGGSSDPERVVITSPLGYRGC